MKQLLLADLKFNYKFYSNKKLAIQTIFRIYILYYYFYTKLCYVHVEREWNMSIDFLFKCRIPAYDCACTPILYISDESKSREKWIYDETILQMDISLTK